MQYQLLLACIILMMACQSPENNRYTIETDAGDIVIEVYPDQAPATVSNFLRYIDRADFTGASFYRAVRLDNQPTDQVKIEVVQGGFCSEELDLPPIAHEITAETGILHKDGVVSMARVAPGSASSAFFICINDQPALDYGGKRNPDGQGFAAFGKVIEGMDVVKNIQQKPTDGQMLKEKITIHRIVSATPK